MARCEENTSECVIVIAIDFGTTFSGVGWARTTKPDQITMVTDWRSTRSGISDREKAPSELSYDETGSVTQWGYGLENDNDDDQRLKWFKLLLLEDNDQPPHLRNCEQLKKTREILQQMNKSATDVVEDYLRALWNHALESIEKNVGKRVITHSRFRVVMTLPAIWKDYAQNRMRRAAEAAGILKVREAGRTELSFITEPEAAAFATLQDDFDRTDFKLDDDLVICDAGGGTVDVVSYSIGKLQPLTVKESVRGDGGLCGAIFLDQNFFRLLKRTVDKGIWNSMAPRDLQLVILDQWENGIKPQFADENTQWVVKMPWVEVQGAIEQPKVLLDREMLLSVFGPMTRQTNALVAAQIKEIWTEYKRKPKCVILVGGFGKSRYLYKYLREHVDLDIDIVQASGTRPWTAICRGAVIHGLQLEHANTSLNMIVTDRVARTSYGTLSNILPWEAKEHDIRDKAWCPIQREFLAVEQVEWFIKAGSRIEDSKLISLSFWQDIAKPEEEIFTELVCSDSRAPPLRYDDSVQPFQVIKWSKIPNFDALPTWTNQKDETFRQIPYDLEMTISGPNITFNVKYDGEVMAHQEVPLE